MKCRACFARIRRSRLCPEHFMDFLAWLNVLHPDAEALYWNRSIERDVMVGAYMSDSDDLVSAWAAFRASNARVIAAYEGRAA